MKIAIYQINPTIGYINKNAKKILYFSKYASKKNIDLILTSELAICGYPPQDLLFSKYFIKEIIHYLYYIAKYIDIPIILGAPIKTNTQHDNKLWNAAVYCFKNQVRILAYKKLLPNYNVFDENRYFQNNINQIINIITIKNIKFGITICEDAWNENNHINKLKYYEQPIKELTKYNIKTILHLSASPFCNNKITLRQQIFKNIAKLYNISIIIAGQTGANDYLTFDGSSMAINKYGNIIKKSTIFNETIITININTTKQYKNIKYKTFIYINKNIFYIIKKAIICGISNYFIKCKLQGAIIGLSGGLDSSIVASLATQAIGSKNIFGITMPSKFSSYHSLYDANKLAQNLNIKTINIPIETHVNSIRNKIHQIKLYSNNYNKDIYDQNLQARIRANILMSIANLKNYVILNTSNKSELSTGYTTIYGDSCGALSPIGDMYKSDLLNFAKIINYHTNIIPHNILHKKPSAELKLHQTDQSTLPNYNILDKILKQYINHNMSSHTIAKIFNINIKLIENIIKKIIISEHKRKQAPICLMLSENVFEKSRKLPIAKFTKIYKY